jgi:hypothetical protein
MQRNPSNAQNLKAAYDPRAGDYWEERFSGVLVVLAVSETHVVICDQKIDLDTGKGWRWNLDKARELSRLDFVKRLVYNTLTGTWANVHRDHHKATVEAWIDKGSPVAQPEAPKNPDAQTLDQISNALLEWAAKHHIYLMAPQWRDLAQRILVVVKSNQTPPA